MSKIEELKLDIEDMNKLMVQAQRQKSKDVLSIEIRKLQTELVKHQERKLLEESKGAVSSSDSSTKCYEVKLNNYGWDQSDKFFKIYVTLKNVQTLPEGAVSCNFDKKSIDLRVLGLENRNYHLPINNLCEEIDTSKSYVKVKTDMIVVYLAKEVPNKQWSCVTGVEKRIKDAKKAPPVEFDKGQDAEGNLMNLMKKMYEDGDDEMKKIIGKAWTESQTKSTTVPDFPSM